MRFEGRAIQDTSPRGAAKFLLFRIHAKGRPISVELN
jgi:hypothetical protein